MIEDLISRGVKKIFVGGFSMGGCLSLYLLQRIRLCQKSGEGQWWKTIQGIFTLGSFVIHQSTLYDSLKDMHEAYGHSLPLPPVFMMHGTA